MQSIKRVSSKPDEDDEDDEYMQIVNVPYGYFENSIKVRQFSFYLNQPIGAPEFYVNMIHQIKCATVHDVVYIYLNTAGGRLDTGIQIINAMRTSQARIITVLESQAFSMGSLIFLSGTEFIVQDFCQMMFHNFSSGTSGKGNEQILELNANIKMFNKMLRKICIPFLSSQEVDRLIGGEDFWMDTEEIRKRLNKMIKELNNVPNGNPKTKQKKNKDGDEGYSDDSIPNCST